MSATLELLRAAQEGDRDACEQAVIENNGLIWSVVRRYYGRGIPDIEKARQPMFTTGGEERSGMGFTIMESFMDRLVVRSTPSRGTTVVMRKRLAPRMQGTK